MELVELTRDDYLRSFKETISPYGTVAFNELNSCKVERLVFLACKDTKGRARVGMIFGRRDGLMECPFSAPFGELSFNGRQKIETVKAFFSALIATYGSGRIRITLPPEFYSCESIPKVAGCLSSFGKLSSMDFNYHYQLSRFPEFQSCLDANARNHLNRAAKAGFKFEQCGLERAYAVIKSNRTEHGYPLRMSLAQMVDTSRLIDVDSFVLSSDGADVAAAIVYRLNRRVAQVIYWGHLSEYGELRPMNMLARDVFGHYHDAGMEIVDVGPSSSDGQPDWGLCTFKESLGCRLSFKLSFVL